MKKIIQIARLEVGLLFYSPIAWLLIMAFFVQMAYAFIPSLAQIQHFQQFIPAFPSLTDRLFTTTIGVNDKFGILFSILGTLYLYIPLITMGLISRETSSGSIQLLYSSPVKISQIIYGKFLSMLIFNFVIIAVTGLFFLLGGLFINHFDYPHVLVAMLASFLLLAAYAAIGIFVSSLTTYQVVAAIGTFMVLAFMNYVGGFGQGLDFVRDLTYSLSMPSRAERMVAGLLTSREVVYYIVVTGIFLAFTIAKLNLARLGKSVGYGAGIYTIIATAGVTLLYLSSRQQAIAYYDATDTKINTIVKPTQEILKKMTDGPVEMTAYINGLDLTYKYGAPVNRLSSIAIWEPYLRFKPDIHLHWVYYYDSLDPQIYAVNPGKSLKTIFKEFAKTQDLDTTGFLNPEQIRSIIDLRGENGRLVIQLKYKGKTTFLRTFDDGDFWPKEGEIAAALKRLIVTPPRIVFATDAYQRSVDKIGDRDYKLLFNNKLSRGSLINLGYDIDSVSLNEGQIPSDIAALVIGDPRAAMSPVAVAKLQQYILNGGNLLIAAEPGKQSIVNPLLDSLGVKVRNGVLVQRSTDYSYGLVTPALAEGSVEMAPGLGDAYQEKAVVSMPGAAALSYTDKNQFHPKTLLRNDAKTAWIKNGTFTLDSAALIFDAGSGDLRGSFPTALMLTRKVKNKQQRIIVSGDADFFSNKELGRNNIKTVNTTFAGSIFSWFVAGEFPVNMSRPEAKDNRLTLSKSGVKTLQVLYYGVIPGTIVLLGMVLLIRRKRK